MNIYNSRSDKNILTTGNIFTETYTLLKDFSEHKFNTRVNFANNVVYNIFTR